MGRVLSHSVRWTVSWGQMVPWRDERFQENPQELDLPLGAQQYGCDFPYQCSSSAGGADTP